MLFAFVKNHFLTQRHLWLVALDFSYILLETAVFQKFVKTSRTSCYGVTYFPSMFFAVSWTSHTLQDLGVKGYSMWKDELKGLDITHALKVVETQAR